METINRLVSTSGEPAFAQTRRPNHRRHLLQEQEVAQFYSGQLIVKILEQMPADPNRQVELLDELILQPVDPSLPVQQLLPGVVNTRAERSRHRHTGDNHIG